MLFMRRKKSPLANVKAIVGEGVILDVFQGLLTCLSVQYFKGKRPVLETPQFQKMKWKLLLPLIVKDYVSNNT